MSELLLIVIIVQLGFVLSRLPRRSKPVTYNFLRTLTAG